MKRILILAVFIATHTFCILPVRAVEARNDSLEAIAAEAAPVDEAVAEAVAAAAITPGIELPDTYGLLVRTLLSLFAVVALIWGAVQLMKRLSPESTGEAGGRSAFSKEPIWHPKGPSTSFRSAARRLRSASPTSRSRTSWNWISKKR